MRDTKEEAWRTDARRPTFYWNAQERYAELFNFGLEVTNILETGAYQISDKNKVPDIRTCLIWGPVADKDMPQQEKRKFNTTKDCSQF